MSANCIICGRPIDPYTWDGPARIKCDVCGKYSISERLVHQLHARNLWPNASSDFAFPVSAYIREQNEIGIEPFLQELDHLLPLAATRLDPLESIDRILLYVYRRTRSAAEYVQIVRDRDYPIANARGPLELDYFMDKAKELGYLESDTLLPPSFRLTLNGWRRVAEIRSNQRDSRQAFVAMWFDSSLTPAYTEGFAPALEESGYKPTRIDLQQHNDKIDDRIIAEIRHSGLLVADFTRHRGGVYFEAGFAMGLGLPVIWTCRADDIENAHFDTRQYNHIVWNEPADLKQKLIDRIAATLPRPGKSEG